MATSTDRTNDTRTILFIDSNVSDYQSLLDGLGSNVEVHLLNNEQDGVSQIAAALQGRSGLDSIQVISHGSSGALSLGSSVLNNSNLENYADALRQIGASLTASGDILLYGCDVAQGNAGVAFVNQLASLTGADVAASNNLTGSSTLGGDWNLEVSTGKIEAPTLAFTSYDGTLGNTPPTGTDDPLIPLSINQVFTFAPAAFGFHDADGDSFSSVEITALPSSSVGVLTLNNIPVTTNQIISVTDINNGLLKFTPTNSATGIATVNFNVNDGTAFSLSSNTLTFNVGVINHAPILTTTNLITNGSFEQGLNNWTINDLANPLTSIRTLASGLPSQWFSLTATPTDGNYVLENGFDGGGGTIAITQAVIVPSGDNDLALNFDYRSAWDMQTYSGSTLPRSFHVDIQTSNTANATVLQSATYLTALQNTRNNDTGILHGAMNLSGYGGQTVYVSFKWDIPQFYTGPADFQLDNVKLLPTHHVLSISTPIILDNTIQVHDIELDALNNYGGASITLARHGGANSEDVFGYSGNLIFGDGIVRLSNASVGTINTNNVGTLTITFANGTTHAQVQEVLSSITYSTSSTPTTPIVIDWIFNDGNTGAQGIGNALTTIGTTIVDIAGAEHAPVISSPYLNQGIAYSKTWSLASHFTDPDGKALTYATTVTGGNGDLTINVNPSTGILSATPSVNNFGKTYSVHITATDTGGLSTSADFTVSVLNFDAGNLFFSTSGNDVFNGVGSNNTVSYANSSTAISASLLNHTVVGDGNDTLNGIENIIGSNYADTLEGDANDVLAGGLGNDTYIINNSNTQIIETSNGGKDNVISSVSYTLPTYVENLTLIGTSDINAVGNNAANVLIGNSGNNILDGRGGIDTMQGGAGNDTYIVDNIHDVIYEDSSHGGSGTDTVISSVTYTLPRDVENLTLTGRSAINGTGNNLNNVIIGNAGNNKLSGGDGNDYISGGAGNDKLIGGAGADTLIGGSGKNVYIYNAASESTLGSVDTIIGTFNGAIADTIQLNSTGTVVVIPSQSAGLSSSALNVTNLNSLLNSTTGTATTKFANSKVNVAVLTTTDSKTFFAIDIDGDGTFTSGDMLMDVTGSTLTSVTPSTFKLSSASITPVPHITLTASASSVDEGSSVTYTVTSDMLAPSGGLSIPYSLSGTATNATDYTGSASTGTITIAAGATSATLPLNVVADNLTEGPETITMTLGTLISGIIDNGYGSVTTIVNDTSLSSAQPASLAGVTLSLDAASDTGVSSTDRITSNNTPNITLSSLNGIVMTAGQQIQILNGSAPSPVAMYTVQASDLTNGVWSYGTKTISISSTLADGTHTLTAILVNLGANPTPSASLNVTIDTVPPVTTATAQTIENTGNAIVQSDEVGTAYLINSTLTQPTTEAAAKVLVNSNSTMAANVQISIINTNTNLPATGLINGTYNIYTADVAGNFSIAASNTVTVATVVGQSFTLTTGADSIIGTSGNDTITGNASTSNVADLIDGGAGNDTLQLTLSSGDTTLNLPTLTNVETLYVNGGALTALTAPSSITTLSIDSPVVNTATTYTVSSGQSVVLTNHVVTANTTTTIATSGSNENITLNNFSQNPTSGVNTLALTGGSLTSAILNTTGSASKFTLTNSGSLASLTITGNQILSLTEAVPTLTNIDASAMTAPFDVYFTGTSRIVGGSGADTINGAASTAAEIISGGGGADSITGGAGADFLYGDNDGTKAVATDTITVAASTNVVGLTIDGVSTIVTLDATTGASTTTAATALAAAVNANTSLTGMITASSTGAVVTVTSLIDGVMTITSANTTATSTVATTTIGTAGAGNGADVLTGGAGNDFLWGGAGADTFNVDSGTDTIGDLGNGADVVVVSASATVNATLAAAWTATAATTNAGTAATIYDSLVAAGGIDLSLASGTTGWTVYDKATSVGTATTLTAGYAIKGSANADTFNISHAGNFVDTITGGAGVDTFNISTTSTAATSITDFGNGADVITDTSTSSAVNATLYNATTGVAAYTAAAGAITTTGANTVVNVITGADTSGTVNLSAITAANNAATGTGGIKIDASSATGGMTLVAPSGLVTIVGGAGNDVIDIMDHTALASITLDGGLGNDTLDIVGVNGAVGAIGDDNFIHIRSIENLMIESTVNSGTITLGTDAADAGIVTVNASLSGITSINATLDTKALTITGGTATATIVGGIGADTINGGSITAATTLVGGTGADTFIINPTDTNSLTIADWGNGADLISGSFTAAGQLKVTINSASTGALDLSTTLGTLGQATVLGGIGNDTIIGGASADSINSGGGSDVLTGGGGADTFNVPLGTAAITDLGNGADIVIDASGATVNATLYSTTPSWTAGTGTWAGTTNITAAPATTAATVTLTAATNTGALKVDLSNSSGAVTYAGPTGGGTQSIIGGTGADAITFAAAVAGAFTVNAGSGTDTITLPTGATTNSLTLTDLAVASTVALGSVGVDTITLGSTTTNANITGFGNSSPDVLILPVAYAGTVSVTAATAVSPTIDLSSAVAFAGTANLSGGAATVTVTLTAPTAGSFTITGSSAATTQNISLPTGTEAGSVAVGLGTNNIGVATTGAVSISEAAAHTGVAVTVAGSTASNITTTSALTATTITGGTGVDTITLANSVSNVATIHGGGGLDVINLGTAHTGGVKVDLSVTTAANMETISNFIHAVDTLQLGGGTGASTAVNVAAYNALGAFGGSATTIVFDTAANLGTLGANITSTTPIAKALYAIASDTGAVYYDAAGTWVVTPAVQIATIGVVTGLLSTDITL